MQQNLQLQILSMEDTFLPPEWLSLAQRLMPDVHPRRQREWAFARYALYLNLAKLGMTLTPDNYHAEGFQKLTAFPVRFSLSHTKNWVAALVSAQPNAAGLGLDIEERTRHISADVERRMHHPMDDTKLSLLERWALKEAAYKALSESEQEGIWLNSISLRSSREVCRKEEVVGNWQLVAHPELVISIVTSPS